MKRVTNKEKIKKYFLELNGTDGVQANEIADELGMKRNAASALLNELTREGFLKKKKTKPVLFSLRSTNKTELSKSAEEEKKIEEDVFREIAGQSYTMEQVLNKCKISATYPGRGIPIMLLGPSGVGKSMLAEKIYLYAKQQRMILEDAPYIVLNCADYANNKELLSSILFGYKKGAFTGANKDTQGLFEKANNGYLLLDEVHRLPPEGQEKLFRYIDTGMVNPLGDGSGGKELNVRLIFATTEDIDNVLLETFIRRIPITVTIPSYPERSSNEKMKIIHNLFLQEAQILNCDFKISSNVMNNLLTFNGKGNIGTLKNIIKISCANALSKKKKDSEMIQITMQDMNVQYSVDYNVLKNGSSSQWIYIYRDAEEMLMPSLDPVEDILKLDSMIEIITKFINNKIGSDRFYKLSKKLIEDVTDTIVYGVESSSIETIYNDYVENIFKFMQNNYGFNYTGTFVIILIKLMALLNRNSTCISEERRSHLYDLQIKLSKRLYRQSKMADLFYEMANKTMDYNANEELLKLFLILFLFCNMSEEKSMSNGIIISHGYSTASSIASLVNQVYSSYIFDAFDMPYDTSKKQIVERVRAYLKKIDTSAGVLILVDMGSILDIIDDLADVVQGNLGVINNVTTQMALEVGNEMIQNQDIEAILKTVVRYNSTAYNFVRNKEKENAILICCGTGVGVASKICDLMRGCFFDQQIKIIEYDYGKIQKRGRDCEVFDLYNVILIISTMDLFVENIEVLPLNELMDSKGYEILNRVLCPIYSTKQIEVIVENIIKSFSLKNIMSQLTILNPEILMNDVGKVIRSMELELEVQFIPDLKQLLYMHIGIMVERLIQERGNVSKNSFEEFAMCHSNFYEIAKRCLFVIEERYHVSVNTREIKLIYDMISSKMENFKG
ncbi:MAG: sigma 54-interacting transcriptional regulator [Anaerostipes faecalis]|nr:sigma 54-interacting transcriptional regulator [Anaerostipes faecalis]